MKPPVSPAPRVIVVGTLNIDRVWTVPHLPRAGETVLARATRREFGGKGANQAVAAARFGAHVTLVGAVGAEPEGKEYRDYLAREGVDVSAIEIAPQATTGTAHVYVDDRGENQIIVDIGASAALVRERVEATLPPLLGRTDMVLTQLETPLAAVLATLRLAAAHGVRAVLNASPCVRDFPWSEVEIDTVVVNEHECLDVFGAEPTAIATRAAAERATLLRRFSVRHLVVTRGAKSTLHFSADAFDDVPAMRVEPLDTVGAGDTFAGVLAVALATSGMTWRNALWQANVAAAVSTQARGAQSAMPTRARIESLLASASGETTSGDSATQR